jgi:hypothetical protein
VALPDLALAADLSARGITPTAVHTTMLAVASSVVRAAAGSPIAETDSTVSLWALDCTPWLPLPGVPVTAVASVVVDGDALDADAYKLVYSDLWRSGSWGTGLAILGASAATEGSHDPRVLVEKIDDYSVTFADDAVASAMELPALTRTWLRSQFGGGAGMVRFR